MTKKGSKIKQYFFKTIFFSTLFLLSLVANFPEQSKFNLTLIKNEEPELKTILLWNTKFEDETFGLREILKEDAVFPLKFSELGCSEQRCIVTFNRFCHTDHRNIKLSDLPDERHENQLYVYYNQESQERFQRPGLKILQKFFNLSMTFRLNSDIPHAYGKFVQVAPHPQSGEDLNKIISNFGAENTQLAEKEKGQSENETLAAQFVSHCPTPSKRENVISRLSKLINTHIYGRCGPLKCGPEWGKGNVKDCYEAMNKTYKFYLAFENSLCEDYVTEKFFNILSYNVIPVVFNGANMSAIAPPHSYINAEDFSSVEQLAEYLQLVASNDSLFASYFWWRDYYKALTGVSYYSTYSWCELCQYLHREEGSHQVKHFDLQRNNLDTGACRKTTLL